MGQTGRTGALPAQAHQGRDGCPSPHRGEAFNQPFKTGPRSTSTASTPFSNLRTRQMVNTCRKAALHQGDLRPPSQTMSLSIYFRRHASATRTLASARTVRRRRHVEGVVEDSRSGATRTRRRSNATALIYTPARRSPRRPATCSDRRSAA